MVSCRKVDLPCNPSTDTFVLVYSGKILAEFVLITQGYFNFATEPTLSALTHKVIAYVTRDKIDRWLVVKALSNALQTRGYPRGVIIDTDRGSNYFNWLS